MNEQQKIEELLKPRVEIENKWPGCFLEVGDILTKEGSFYYLYSEQRGGKINVQNVEPFPYLMRPLSWWEKRSVEEMPDYVKVTETGEVYRVTRYYIDHNFACFYTGELEKRGKLKGTETPFNLEACTPATESEYIAYVDQKVNQ